VTSTAAAIRVVTCGNVWLGFLEFIRSFESGIEVLHDGSQPFLGRESDVLAQQAFQDEFRFQDISGQYREHVPCLGRNKSATFRLQRFVGGILPFH
jgi:hypothetical protein